MKKGPVCYIYYTIKNKRQLKLEREKTVVENDQVISQTKIYKSKQ
jgi:hypothetical protein